MSNTLRPASIHNSSVSKAGSTSHELRRATALIVAGVIGAGLASAVTDTPIPLRKVGPYFPIEAACAGKSGDVTLTVDVDKNGHGSSIFVLDETPYEMGFATSAKAALNKWTFQPGHPGTYRARIHFALDPELVGRSAMRADGVPVSKKDAPIVNHRAPPSFPERALRRQISGDALVLLDVDASGAVTRADLYQDVPVGIGFGDAAVDAVKRWGFVPGRPGRYSVCVKFRL